MNAKHALQAYEELRQERDGRIKGLRLLSQASYDILGDGLQTQGQQDALYTVLHAYNYVLGTIESRLWELVYE